MFYIKHNMEMCICVICDVGHYQAESNSIYANVFLVIMLVFFVMEVKRTLHVWVGSIVWPVTSERWALVCPSLVRYLQYSPSL